MPSTVNLGQRFERFVADQVASGRFANVSEVVRAGLRLLEEQEQERQMRLEELRSRIREGMASGDAGPVDMDAVMDEAIDRASKAKRRGHDA